jgi:hypothetical protein
MKTTDIIGRGQDAPAVNMTTDNPNGLAHEQAQMDVAVAEVQEDLLELYKRFIELRDTYARLKMRRGEGNAMKSGAAKPTSAPQPQAVAEARGSRRQRR